MSDELVWREEIQKEAEYLGEGVRNLSNFYHRAKSQGAPGPLLDEMALVWQDLEKARKRLEAIVPCFSPEPRGPR